ncbi:unnamed protein product [Calypogeia fissa]
MVNLAIKSHFGTKIVSAHGEAVGTSGASPNYQEKSYLGEEAICRYRLLKCFQFFLVDIRASIVNYAE